MKILKKVWNWCVFLLTGKGKIAESAVDDGICNFGGQGKDEFGR